MDKELIQKINKECPYDQGIFSEGYGIPVHIKEPCIYSRWETGGMTGGSCWGTEAHSYSEDVPKNRFEVLDIVLKTVAPSITYLQYKDIEKLWHDNNDSQHEYYGNSTDYHIDYMILSDLEKLIESFNLK